MKRLIMGVVIAATLAAAACGGGEEGSQTTEAAATSAATTTAADTGAAPAETSVELSPGTVESGQRALGSDVTLTPEEQAAVEANSSGKLVGIVAATMKTEYHKLLNEAVKKKAEELGFEAEIFDAAEDPNKTIAGIESFVSKGAVAIVVTPLGGEGIGPAAADAIAAGAMVVQATGRDLATEGAITVSVEEEAIGTAEGKAAGEYAAATFPGKAVQVALTDYPSIPSLVERADYIEDAMLAADPDIEVVGRFLGGTPDNGVKSIETALQKFPDIQGIVGINDAGNLGAYQAMKTAGKTAEDAFIFGIDCDPAAVKLIDEGTMYKGCVDTNPTGTGEIAVTAFAKWFAGGSVPQDLEVPVSVYTGQ